MTQFTGQGEVHECIDHYLDRWGEAYYQELQQFVNEVQAGEQTQSATAADCTGAVKLAEMMKARLHILMNLDLKGNANTINGRRCIPDNQFVCKWVVCDV